MVHLKRVSVGPGVRLYKNLIDVYQNKQAAYQRNTDNQEGWSNYDELFLMVATALASRLTQNPQRQQDLEIVQERLKSFKQFSDNDYIALKLLLHFMSLKDAEAVVKKPLKLLTDLKEPGLSENL